MKEITGFPPANQEQEESFEQKMEAVRGASLEYVQAMKAGNRELISNLQRKIGGIFRGLGKESEIFEIKSAGEFYEQVAILDSGIEKIEKKMNCPVNFADPHSLGTFLDTYSKRGEENLNDLEKALKGNADESSSAIRFIAQCGLNEDRIQEIWPARVPTKHAFQTRLIARAFVNELIKRKVIQNNSEEEKAILKAFPFVSAGHAWGIGSEATSQDILLEHEVALDLVFSLPEAKSISSVVREIAPQYEVLFQNYRDKSEEMKEMERVGLDYSLKEIMQQTRDSEDEGEQLFGHGMPYALHAVKYLQSKEISEIYMKGEKRACRESRNYWFG